jgi:hypothetical protein
MDIAYFDRLIDESVENWDIKPIDIYTYHRDHPGELQKLRAAEERDNIFALLASPDDIRKFELVDLSYGKRVALLSAMVYNGNFRKAACKVYEGNAVNYAIVFLGKIGFAAKNIMNGIKERFQFSPPEAPGLIRLDFAFGAIKKREDEILATIPIDANPSKNVYSGSLRIIGTDTGKIMLQYKFNKGYKEAYFLDIPIGKRHVKLNKIDSRNEHELIIVTKKPVNIKYTEKIIVIDPKAIRGCLKI